MGPASAHLPLLLVSLTTTAAASAAATAASATAAVAAATAMACLFPLLPCCGHVAPEVVLSFSVYDLTKLHRRFSLGGFVGEVLWSVFFRPRSPRNHFDALPIASHKWVVLGFEKKKNSTCVKSSNFYEGQRKKSVEVEEGEGKNRAYEWQMEEEVWVFFSKRNKLCVPFWRDFKPNKLLPSFFNHSMLK